MTNTISADEYNATVGKKPKSKYSNVKTEVDGILFDSKAEARRYEQLKLMVRANAIRDLTLQPKFPILINGVKVCTYIADFEYVETGSDTRIVEDVKGTRTSVYSLKAKLVKAVHGITITEVKR